MYKFTPDEVDAHIKSELRSGEHKWDNLNIDPQLLAKVAGQATEPQLQQRA